MLEQQIDLILTKVKSKFIKFLLLTFMTHLKKVSSFSTIAGALRDCWFVSALSTLAENEHFLHKVIPTGQGFSNSLEDHHGIFRFRFYRFGEWEEIVIDDRLPTR